MQLRIGAPRRYYRRRPSARFVGTYALRPVLTDTVGLTDPVTQVLTAYRSVGEHSGADLLALVDTASLLLLAGGGHLVLESMSGYETMSLTDTVSVRLDVGRRRSITASDLLTGLSGQRKDSVRYEILDADLNPVWPFRLFPSKAGHVAWRSSDQIMRTLTGLELDAVERLKIAPGVHRIRVVYEVPGIGYEKPLGTFLYQGGPEPRRSGHTWVTCDSCPDPSWQLNQGNDEPYHIDEASLITAVFADLAAEAGIPLTSLAVTPSGQLTAPDAPLVFPIMETTWLAIAAKATALLGYLPPHFNRDVQWVLRPVPILSETIPDHRYVNGQRNVVLKDSVTTGRSFSARANVYVGVATTPSTVPVTARLVVPESADNSWERIKYKVTKKVPIDGAATNAEAMAILAAVAERDAQKVRTIKFTTPINPEHDCFDVIDWYDPADEYDHEHMLETAWDVDLHSRSMSHEATSVYASA